MMKRKVPLSSSLKIKNSKKCLFEKYLLFQKVQVVAVKNLFIIIFTFFTLYFFTFVCFVKYLLEICSGFLHVRSPLLPASLFSCCGSSSFQTQCPYPVTASFSDTVSVSAESKHFSSCLQGLS